MFEQLQTLLADVTGRLTLLRSSAKGTIGRFRMMSLRG